MKTHRLASYLALFATLAAVGAGADERVLLREDFDAPGVEDGQFLDQPPLEGWRHSAGEVRVSRQTGFGPDTLALWGRGVPHWGGRAEHAFDGPMPETQRCVLSFQAFIARELDVDGKKLSTRYDYFGFAGCGSMDGPYWCAGDGEWRFDARALDGETIWTPENQDGAVNRVVDCAIVWDLAARECRGRLEYEHEDQRTVIETPPIGIPLNRLYEIRALCAYTKGYNMGENYGMDVDNIRLTVTETARPEAPAAGANLLFNGDFEIDANNDGLPDGWALQPVNVATETLADVQDYTANLPALEELLADDTIRAHDGWPLARRGDGGWPVDMDAAWYDRLPRELIKASRFGEMPLPDGLKLGSTTCVLSSLPPRWTVASAPVPVEPRHGYRLSGWYRTSGGAQTLVLPQVLDAAKGGIDSPVWGENMLNCIAPGWAGVPQWRRFEVPFRTPDDCDRVIVRLWYYFSGETDPRRLWYDDLELVADDSVVLGEITEAPAFEPDWTETESAQGFAVYGRPAFPVADRNWIPPAVERAEPLRFALCAGEIGSASVFVRAATDTDLPVQVRPANPLKSDNGYAIENAYGARAITLRAVENGRVNLDAKRYRVRPAYLLHTDKATAEAGTAAQFWMTVEVPAGTPPGIYRGEVKVQPLDPESGKKKGTEAKLSVELTVRDMVLPAADTAFGTWYITSPKGGPLGPDHVLPGSEEIYLADQRRHGMNTVATYTMAERLSADGDRVVTLNEIDAAMTAIRRAGLCRRHPVLIYTWQEDGAGGGFGFFGGGEQTVMSIFEHGKQAGWPEILFGVLDEQGASPAVFKVAKMYEQPREQGVRTVTAGPDPYHTGHLYDVWIETMARRDWPELHELAAKTAAEVWMYDCSLTGRNPLLERFYAGLWTWRTGCRGNMVWCYGWYVRINETGLPESKIAWEGRLAGVNDYRYLQALEAALAAAREAGHADTRAAAKANTFLERLRGLVPLDTYAVKPQGDDIAVWNPVPGLEPTDYARIPERCSRHITALQVLPRQ